MCEYELSIEECVWDLNVLHWAIEGMSLTAFYHDMNHVEQRDLEDFSMLLDRVYRNLKKAMEREDKRREGNNGGHEQATAGNSPGIS